MTRSSSDIETMATTPSSSRRRPPLAQQLRQLLSRPRRTKKLVLLESSDTCSTTVCSSSSRALSPDESDVHDPILPDVHTCAHTHPVVESCICHDDDVSNTCCNDKTSQPVHLHLRHTSYLSLALINGPHVQLHSVIGKEFRVQLEAMLELEDSAYNLHDCRNYRDKYGNEKAAQCESKVGVGACRIESWRKTACQWSYDVCDKLKFQRELVAITMSYVDRYMLLSEDVDSSLLCERAFRVLALTSLYIAIKVHRPEFIPIACYTSLYKDINEPDIENMEMKIGFMLNWRLHPPTAVSFVRLILRIVSSEMVKDIPKELKDNITLQACFITELASSDHFFVTQKSSHVGLASILLSIEQYCTPTEAKEWKDQIVNVCGDILDSRSLRLNVCRDRLSKILYPITPE